jgi:hypothetical protein
MQKILELIQVIQINLLTQKFIILVIIFSLRTTISRNNSKRKLWFRILNLKGNKQ